MNSLALGTISTSPSAIHLGIFKYQRIVNLPGDPAIEVACSCCLNSVQYPGRAQIPSRLLSSNSSGDRINYACWQGKMSQHLMPFLKWPFPLQLTQLKL